MLELFNILDEITDNTTLCAGIEVPDTLFNVVATIIRGIKIVVPILLIIFGMMDLAKAVMAQKEDEIKKGQQTFIKRIIAAVIVFFVITIVQMIISFVSNDNDDIGSCFKCFVNGDASACTPDNSGTKMDF